MEPKWIFSLDVAQALEQIEQNKTTPPLKTIVSLIGIGYLKEVTNSSKIFFTKSEPNPH